jgi:DNA-binding transcriptional regulator YiaG
VTVPVELRVPNRTLRAIRLALQMSQSEFATSLRHAGEALGEPNNANKRLVQKWESGEHTVCRPKYRRALQSVTRTPYEQLGFTGTPTAPVTDTVAPCPRVGTLLEADGPDAGGTVLVDGLSADRLRFAVERPGQADLESIALVETATAQLFDLEHHRPARALLPAVVRQIDDISALLSGTKRETLRRRLAVAGGRAAALAGWLAFERGDCANAHKFWDAALAMARYASDGPLLACVFTYLSYSSAERGDPATAWQLAHTAIAHAGTDVRSRSWMAARAAEEAALLGERRAALAELDLAMQLGRTLTLPEPEDPTPPWARFYYRAVLAAMAANVHGRLGNPGQARDAAAWALRTVSGEKVKSRALILAEVACAHARIGEVELAVESAHEAANLAEHLNATFARRKLRTLIALLSPYTTAVPVRELLTRLHLD